MLQRLMSAMACLKPVLRLLAAVLLASAISASKQVLAFLTPVVHLHVSAISAAKQVVAFLKPVFLASVTSTAKQLWAFLARFSPIYNSPSIQVRNQTRAEVSI